ncbi:FusB/FusC family EF-G-binding protein [Neobacillus sp. D3-1R]|uniref:FusB/FusC family EF-G-binding protein n=1 Tax=Neobacillus sp. D3-1R TaxID=3445778 RepID=UPI003F9F8FB9
MEPFLRVDQYQFIKNQTKHLINGYASVNDKKVLNALKSTVYDKVLNLFHSINEDQKLLVDRIIEVEDHAKAEEYLSALKPYVIPFQMVTEQTLKKLFPKAKKLKLPSLDEIDLKEVTYLGWNDKGTNKKYIIALQPKGFVGLEGSFTPASKKGICTLCSRHAQVGLFMSETKGAVQGTYTRRGNYICQDSIKCNENLTSVEKLDEFIELLKG